MNYVAFTIGLFGSLHCLGMCGPIAFALPVRTSNRYVKLFKYLLYNMGRVTTYTVLGLVFGIVGKGFAIAGMQQILSIIAGVLIILSVLLVHKNYTGNNFFNNLTNRIKGYLRSAFRFYFQKSGAFSLFVLGVLNGLLPCGMVYMALLGALSMVQPLLGAAFMTSFGLGTIPLMLTVSLAGGVMSERMKSYYFKLAPVMACVVGVLLIMRGLNLGIPFISPAVSCCHASQCH